MRTFLKSKKIVFTALTALLFGFMFVLLSLNGTAGGLQKRNLFAATSPALEGVSGTGDKLDHVINTDAVSFNEFGASGSVGITGNPRAGDYDLRQRGPSNTNQGTALAYTSYQGDKSNGGGDVSRWASLQVFIGVGGDLAAAIDNGVVTELTFDFYMGLGALVNNPSMVTSYRRAWTTFDLSLDLQTDTDKYKLWETKGDIFAGEPANREKPGIGILGEINGAQDGNNWAFSERHVDVTSHMKQIAEQGGFWIKLYSYTNFYNGWAFASYWNAVACVFEGVRYNAVFEDRSVTFQTDDPVNGLKTVDKKFYEKTRDATLSATAAAGENGLYFTNWSGGAVNSDPNRLDVTAKSYLNSPAAVNNVVANYAAIPIEGENSYTFNTLPQGPSVSAPEGYTAVNESYTGTRFSGDPYGGTAKPVYAGDYIYHAALSRDGVIMGEIDYDFVIERATGAAGTLVMPASWIYGEHADIVPSVTGQTAEYVNPTFRYRHHKTGAWVLDMPTEPGVHYARAGFASTDNYEPDETPYFEFEILKITVDLPSAAGGLTYSGEEVNPGLSETEYYTVSGELSGIGAGDYTAVLTLKDPAHYAWSDGTDTAAFGILWTVKRLDISEAAEIRLDGYSFTYIEDTPQVPGFTVFYNDGELTEGVHFTVPGFEAVNAGDKVFAVEFTGNYTGVKEAKYRIEPKKVARPTGATYIYDGAEKIAGDWLTETDFYEIIEADGYAASATSAGGYTTGVKIKAGGNYAFDNGAVILIVDWEILPQALTEGAFTFTPDAGGYTYNGSAQIPFISVTDNGGQALTDGVDYVIENFNPIDAGKKTVRITLTGNYTGGFEATYEIEQAVLSDGALTLSNDEFTYIPDTPQRPAISVSVPDIGELVFNTDYTIADFDDINAGVKTVKVTFVGNFSGFAQKTYTILKAESAVNIVVARHGIIYTGGMLPAISLGAGSTEGTVQWLEYTLTEGVHSYVWRYTSASGNYTEQEGFVEFTAVLAVLKDIQPVSLPEKLNYKAFEKLDVSGLTVEIINEDGAVGGEINFYDTTAYSVIYLNGESFRAGDTSVTIVYRKKTVVIDVTVTKAVPPVTVPPGLTACYGDKLSDIVLGAGFAFESSLGTLVGDAGANRFTVSFTPDDTDNYETVYGIEVFIEVSKKDSVVTPVFGAVGTLYTSGSLPSVSLSEGDTAGTVSWDAYTLVSGEYGYIWTFIPENPNYTVVTGSKNYTATVAGFLEIRLAAMPSLTSYNAFDAVDLSGAEVEIVTEDGLVSGVLDLNGGDYQIIYRNGADGFYANETDFILSYNGFELSVPVTVNKLAPQFDAPQDLTARYGDLLSSVALPEGFGFVSFGTVGNAGENSFTVLFTPGDSVNYAAVEITVTVAVSKAAAAVITEDVIGENMVSSTTENSFTVTPPAIGAGQELEYAVSADGNVPEDGWQSEFVFGALESDTVYYVFARPKANANFEEGEAVLIDEVRTAAGSLTVPSSRDPVASPSIGGAEKRGTLFAVFVSVAALALGGSAVYLFKVKKRSAGDLPVRQMNRRAKTFPETDASETAVPVMDSFENLEETPKEVPLDL